MSTQSLPIGNDFSLAYSAKPIVAASSYSPLADTTTVGAIPETIVPTTPLTDFAEELARQGILAVEEVISIEQQDYLEIWVVVDDADRDTRRAIHEVEWDLMMRYTGMDFRFELLRRRGRDRQSLVTFPPTATYQSLRGMNAYHSRAYSAGHTQ